MPVRLLHDFGNLNYVLSRNTLVEQVAHAVDKHHPRPAPTQGLTEFFRHQPQVETLFIRMSRHISESFRERFGVTMSASRADLGAAANRIPGGIRPFNGRALTHNFVPRS